MRLRLYGALLSVVFLASCASKESAPDKSAASSMEDDSELAMEREERRGSTGVDKAERQQASVADLVSTTNRFAFDLFSARRSDDFVVSPYGVATVLAIAQAGADGATSEQVSTTLRTSMGERDLHSRMSKTSALLRERETPQTRDGRGFRFRVVSGVWHAEDVRPRSRFARIATNDHLAHVEGLNFAGAPRTAATKVETFVSDATLGKFAAPIPDGRVGPLTRVLLTNAAFFEAPWTVPFDRAQTKTADFAAPGGVERVAMMHNVGRFGYLEGEGFAYLELPYGDGEVVASIILPAEARPDFDSALTADWYAWASSQARQTPVDVQLPRFAVEANVGLSKTLAAMGMRDAFDPETADLSRLAHSPDDVPLYLNDVVHQARVSVDEDGSDAAANVVSGVFGGAGREVAKFHATRPFVFIVRDLGTGAILMMAKVSNPE